MKNFLKKFLSLLDKEDKKGFIGFIFILMLGGFISLLGIASIIPFVNILINPDKVRHLPLLGVLPYFEALTLAVVALIVAFWLRAITGMLIIKKQSTFLFGLTAKIRFKLFKNYLDAPYTYHINKNSSSLISVLSTDIQVVSSNIFSAAGIVLNEAITSGIVFIALLFLAPVFVISVVGSIFIATKIYMSLSKSKAVTAGNERANSYRGMTQCVTQSLGSLKETKLYHKEGVFVRLVKVFSEKIAKANAFEAVFSFGSRYLIEAVAITVVLVMLLIYAFLGYTGQQIFILLSVFGVASVQLLPSLNRMIQGLASMRCGIPSLIKVHDEFQSASLACAHAFCKKNIDTIKFNKSIHLKEITFSYSNKSVLNRLSIEIQKGKKIALVGESGAGKTTIADILLGLLQPLTGGLYIDEKELKREDILGWQTLLGYIPQMIYLYDSDIRQNIAFGVPEEEINDGQVNACLEMASLTEFVNALPETIHTKVGENGIQLSGGQRQRIGIARALYRNPSVLIMDEATSALDNKTEAEVTQALTAVGEGRTIITIAHRISTIAHYDVIYYLQKGTIIAQGSYQELMESSNEFRGFVQSSLASSNHC